MSSAQSGADPQRADTEFRSGWGWFVALGVALCVLGFLAFGNLALATMATLFYIGALMLIGAVVHVIHAFRVKQWGGFFFWLLSGLLYGVAGVIIFYNPAVAAATLTLLFAFALIAAGILRVWSSLRLRPRSGWGWILMSGAITALVGVVFAVGWPVNSLWLLGLVLAVDLTFQGAAAIAFGMALKAHR